MWRISRNWGRAGSVVTIETGDKFILQNFRQDNKGLGKCSNNEGEK